MSRETNSVSARPVLPGPVHLLVDFKRSLTVRTRIGGLARNVHVMPLLVIAMLWCTGCGGGTRKVTLPVWQRNVEQYVRQQASGDPLALRDVTLPDSRRGFAVLGSDRPAESSDAYGLLLGFREIDGQNWFIYLVGLVRQEQVEAIRLAAFSSESDRSKWKLGSHDREALERYRDHSEQQWRARFPDRQTGPIEYTGFPRPDDQFRLSVSGSQVSVIHPASGASWELNLPAAPR
jgi:hypothetical protein